MSIIAEALKKAEREAVKHPAARPAKRRPLFVFITVILFTFVIALALSAILLHFSTVGFEKEEPQVAHTPATVAPAAVPAPISVSRTEPEPVIPPVTLADVKENIKLNGIMYTPEGPLAVVNDEIWTEGEYINNFKILKIGKDFIKVGSGEEEFVLKLKR